MQMLRAAWIAKSAQMIDGAHGVDLGGLADTVNVATCYAGRAVVNLVRILC